MTATAPTADTHNPLRVLAKGTWKALICMVWFVGAALALSWVLRLYGPGVADDPYVRITAPVGLALVMHEFLVKPTIRYRAGLTA